MIVVPVAQWERLTGHVAQAAPEEACGLLAAFRYSPGVVELAVPMLNMAEHARYRYEIDPRHHMEAVAKLDAQNLKVIGIYHSHIGAGPELSDHDLRYAVDPSKVHLVVSHTPAVSTYAWAAWRVERGEAVPVELHIV
jgi:proteasome lid subunit RPN8/RPN11